MCNIINPNIPTMPLSNIISIHNLYAKISERLIGVAVVGF